MKKFAFAALIAITTLALCSCAPTAVATPKLDAIMPWFAYRTFSEEHSRFEVVRYDHTAGKVAMNENSYLDCKVSQTLDSSNNVLYILESEYSFSYKRDSSVPEELRGKTDKLTTKAVFRRDNLTAVETHKTAELETDSENSYSFDVSYTEGKASFESNGETKEISFAKGSYFDNEYLFYYVRAMKNMGETLSEQFSLVNWYDCFLAGRFFTVPMVAAYFGADSASVPDNVLNALPADAKDSEAKTAACVCVQVRLNNESGKNGAPLYGYYTKGSYAVNENGMETESRKLIARMQTFESDMRGNVTYEMEYTLREFGRKV